MSLAQAVPAVDTRAATMVLPRRVVALIIDILILSGVEAWVNHVFGVTRISGGSLPAASRGFASFTTSTTVDWPWTVAVLVAYFAVPEVLFGATPGKAWVGLRVCTVQGGRPTAWALVPRNLLRPVDALPFGYLLGGALVLISRSRQRLGDRLAGTVVMARGACLAPPLSRQAFRGRLAALVAVLALLFVVSLAFFYWGRPPLVIEGLRNTAGGFFGGQAVSDYRLGAPRWGSATVTYPVSYQTRKGQSCDALLTLRWTGFPGGWIFSGGQATCSN